MCLYSITITNKRYQNTKKNRERGFIPKCCDERQRVVRVPCGHCIECRRKRAKEWRIRLQEECKYDPNGIFVTLTFNDKALSSFEGGANEVATKAVRLFMERLRKKYKHSFKHWLITELGHKGTERVHLHGIIWGLSRQEIKDKWNYGYVYCGDSINGAVAGYVTKYITKIDKDHKLFTGKILCSKGIGASLNVSQNQYRGRKTMTKIKDFNGHQIELPRYYRNRIYNEDERAKLWSKTLDDGFEWIGGVKVSTNDWDRMNRMLLEARKRNEQKGYANLSYFEQEHKVWAATNKKIKRRCDGIHRSRITAQRDRGARFATPEKPPRQ